MLKDPIFKEYHIFFTTPLDEDVIKILADCDTHNVLRNLYEIFVDYEAVNADFASLSMAEAYLLNLETSKQVVNSGQILKRTFDGLAG